MVQQDAGREVTLEQTANEYFGMDRYGDFQANCNDEVADFLENFQNRLAAVDEQAIEEKLASSEKDMNVVANGNSVSRSKSCRASKNESKSRENTSNSAENS